MYRDDPLDDEEELRAIVGDGPVDQLLAAGPELTGPPTPIETALEVLRVLQGWVSDDEAAAWFAASQRRLDDRTPIQALTDGDEDDVRDAARRWVAAQG